MSGVLEAIEDFLKEEFGGYQFMGAGRQQKPTPNYRKFVLNSHNMAA